MSFENAFENPYQNKPPEEKKAEKIKPEAEQAVSRKEMLRWQELETKRGQNEFSREFFEFNGDLHELPKELWEEMEKLNKKAEKERASLAGPFFNRWEILSNNKKKEEVKSFMYEWIQLSDEEKLKRLDRCWNELQDMWPSNAAKKEALKKMIEAQEKISKGYWESLQNPINKLLGSSKLERRWHQGEMKIDFIAGPNPNSLEFLMSMRNVVYYLDFLKKWEKLDPKQQKEKLQKAKSMEKELFKEWNGEFFEDGIPKSIFERMQEEIERYDFLEEAGYDGEKEEELISKMLSKSESTNKTKKLAK